MAGSVMPSLLDDPVAAAPSPARAQGRVLDRLVARVLHRPRAWWRARMDDPVRRGPTIKRARIAGAGMALAAIVGGYFALRPVPQPDYLYDGLDEVFNFTLLTEEFNKLPVEKRLELLGQLAKRLQSMSAQDSLMMAAFASGVAGAAREQLEENVSLLMIDMWDKHAKGYDRVPPEQRGEYLDQTFLSFVKTIEAATGQVRDVSDEERLAEARRQGQRDRRALNDPNRGPTTEGLARMVTMLEGTVGARQTPQQRARGMLMMRDMTRRFRDGE